MAKIEAEYEYTDAELLAILREALVAVMVKGQTYQFKGQIFTRASAAELREQIAWLEKKVSTASSGLKTLPVKLKRAR